jgi:hypothetical protein
LGGRGAQGSRHAQILQEEALRQVDLRRRMRATVVPTGDGDVRRLLRQLGEPVTLFGEQQARTQRCLSSSRECMRIAASTHSPRPL